MGPLNGSLRQPQKVSKAPVPVGGGTLHAHFETCTLKACCESGFVGGGPHCEHASGTKRTRCTRQAP